MGMNHIRKQEEVKRRKMTIFKSPGVYSNQIVSIVRPKFSKKYLRRIKIGKIFGIDVPNVIITSTPKGIQIW